MALSWLAKLCIKAFVVNLHVNSTNVIIFTLESQQGKKYEANEKTTRILEEEDKSIKYPPQPGNSSCCGLFFLLGNKSVRSILSLYQEQQRNNITYLAFFAQDNIHL